MFIISSSAGLIDDFDDEFLQEVPLNGFNFIRSVRTQVREKVEFHHNLIGIDVNLLNILVHKLLHCFERAALQGRAYLQKRHGRSASDTRLCCSYFSILFRTEIYAVIPIAYINCCMNVIGFGVLRRGNSEAVNTARIAVFWGIGAACRGTPINAAQAGQAAAFIIHDIKAAYYFINGSGIS